MLASADPDADLEGALVDWRQYRRKKRVADIHWIDAFYNAYLTGIVGLIVVAVASGAIGDDAATPAQVSRLLDEGRGWLGVVAAFALALGLRSGALGGPLALERAEVRHVLLAPVDRTSALRTPALRQLRFVAFVGIVVGGILGHLAAQRLAGAWLAWVATGALTGLVVVGLTVGAALVVAAVRVPRWATSGIGLALLALAVADGTGQLATSPTGPFGDLVLWPLRFHLDGLVPVVSAAALVVAGLALLGRSSLEAAERRSTLVGQIRFAATMQDLRTVIVLRRQLAMELPRLRPWIRLRVRGTGRWPVFVRGLRGVLRWPAARVARLVLLGAVAGLALRGTWAGTTPLVALAGLAMFIVGLDAVESLAQEVDHPSRRDASPLDAAAIHLRHVPVGVLAMLVSAGVAGAVAAVPGPGELPRPVAALLIVSLALGGLGGALVSVLASPVSVSEGWSLAPPEAQSMRLAFRTAWPPGIAVLGAAPVLAARAALDGARPALDGARPAVTGVLVLFALVCGWVRVRDDIAAWFKAQMELAQPQRDRTTEG